MIDPVRAIVDILLAANVNGADVWPLSIPQGAHYPAVRVYRTGGAPLYADDGPIGLEQARIAVETMADSLGEAKGIAAQVTQALSGIDAIETAGELLYCMLEDERDDREGGTNVADYPFVVSQTYALWLGE